MTDDELRCAVRTELDWDPAVDTSGVEVTVRAGTVRLTGTVNSYAEKCRTIRSARVVRGVAEVDDAIEVRILDENRCSDPVLRESVATAVRLNVLVASSIDVTIELGWVTLTGAVATPFERDEAEWTAGRVPGVRGLTTRIEIVPFESGRRPADPAPAILEAIGRRRDIDADDVTVSSNGETVTVGGTVGSDGQRAAVVATAWKAPGVVAVIDRIRVAESALERPTERACARLTRMVEQLRADVDALAEMRTRVLFVTTADLLVSLRDAFVDADARARTDVDAPLRHRR